MDLLESMSQNSYPPQAGTASKHPPVVPKSKKWNRKQTTKWLSQTTPHSSSHATMPQSEKLSHEKEGRNQQWKPGWRVTVRLSAAPHFLPAIGLGSIPGRCLLIQPVGSHRLVAMSSRRGPPCCKRINVQPGGSMSLNAKTKEDKMGVATPDALSTQCACPPHGGCLPGRPSQDSPAQCSKWHRWPGPSHWRCWTSSGALGWDQPSGAHRGEELLVPASCRTRCGPSPICCRVAPEAHPRPSGGPHCPRWSEESGSSPSFPSKNPCTICSNSLHVSHPSLFGPFPRGWHCSKPSHIPCAPRRHGACLQGSSSSCNPCRKRRPRCSQWWVVCVPPHSPGHRRPQWWWMEQGNGHSAVLPGSDDRYELVPLPGAWHPGLSGSHGLQRGWGPWLQWRQRSSPAWHRGVLQPLHQLQHANTV